MKTRRELITLLGGAAAAWPVVARGQQSTLQNASDLIVGAWAFVSSINLHANSRRTDRWGPDATGLQIFDRSGYFTLIIKRPKSLILGSKTFYAFGSYSIETSESSAMEIIVKNIDSSIIGSNGVMQSRKILTLTEKELVYVNPMVLGDHQTVEVRWKRLP